MLILRQTADKQHREAPAILIHHLVVSCLLVAFVKHRGEREPRVDLFVMIEQRKFHRPWVIGVDMSLLQYLQGKGTEKRRHLHTYTIFHAAKVKNKTTRTKKKRLIVDDQSPSFFPDPWLLPTQGQALIKWGWFSSPKRGLKMKPSSANALKAFGSLSLF